MRQSLWFMLLSAAFLFGAYIIDYCPAVSALCIPVMLYAYHRGELWEVHSDDN